MTQEVDNLFPSMIESQPADELLGLQISASVGVCLSLESVAFDPSSIYIPSDP